MSQSFFLRSIDSDLSVGGALFNRQLLETTGTASTQLVSVAQNGTVDAYAFTEPGIPGTDGGAGDYTVSIHVTAGATQINNSVRVARVDSDGVVQSESGFSTPDVGNAGVKVHEIPSVDLGTWASGDRLRVQYRFENTDNMMTRELTIELDTAETEAITPWTGGAPDPAEASGTVAAEGSLSATGQTPAGAVPQASGTVTSEGSLSAVGHQTPGASGSVAAEGSLSATGSAPAGEAFDPPDADVTINGTTGELTWSASPTPGVTDYQVFRRTPQTGAAFDPEVDTPVATGITDLFYDDVGLDPGDFEWQVFGRVPA